MKSQRFTKQALACDLRLFNSLIVFYCRGIYVKFSLCIEVISFLDGTQIGVGPKFRRSIAGL